MTTRKPQLNAVELLEKVHWRDQIGSRAQSDSSAVTHVGAESGDSSRAGIAVNRREGLLAMLFGTGYVGLRALATGVPAAGPTNRGGPSLRCATRARRRRPSIARSSSSSALPVRAPTPSTATRRAPTTIRTSATRKIR